MSSNDWQILAAAAAYYYSQDKSQQTIAKLLGLASQSKVARLLEYARIEGWLGAPKPPPFHRKKVGRLWKTVQERYFSESNELRIELGKLSKGRLNTLEVIHAVDQDAFFSEAERLVEGILLNVRSVGVTWGRSVWNLVHAMEARSGSLSAKRTPITFFPLCGEPFQGRTSQEYSSSYLSEKFHKLWNDRSNPHHPALTPPSIAGVPAFIPETFSSTEEQAVRKIVNMGAGYKQVFGSEPGLVGSAEMFLTGVGTTTDGDRGIFLQERIAYDSLQEGDMTSLVGDLGGVIIPKRKADDEFQKKIQHLNERWTGVQLKDIRRCADKNRSHGGVVAVVWSDKRVPLLYRGIHDRLLNTLIVSGEVASALQALVKSGAEPD